MVRTEDGCRLWTTETGHGEPLIVCHGGPGLWDMFGDVSGTGLGSDWRPHYQRNLAARLGTGMRRLKELRGRDRAVLQWSADFADPTRAADRAERMADPWFEINYECNTAMSAEKPQVWREAALIPACRELTVPTLIVDGAQDIRPRWAVDSLEQALPSATRVVLDDVGHVPWLEAPEKFRSTLLDHLRPPS